MDIQPADLSQVVRARDGNMVLIEDDVLDIAKQLHEIDPRLRVHWSEVSEHFAVYTSENEEEHLVTTCQELDQRLVNRIREIAHPSYNYGEELDRIEAKQKAESEQQFSETVGELAERLAHALRSDLGYRKDASRTAEWKYQGAASRRHSNGGPGTGTPDKVSSKT